MDQSNNLSSLKPKISYTIWFTQRTGSTLLAHALAGTGIAGKPDEWLQKKTGPLKNMDEAAAAELRSSL